MSGIMYGNPNFIVPTPPTGDSSHRAANTEFVSTAIANSSSTLAAATQAEMEAGTSTSVYVSPGRQQFHVSAAKAWISYTYSGGTPTSQLNYNVSSLTDNGTGDATINFATAFSTTAFTFVGSSQTATSVVGFLWGPWTQVPTTTSFRVIAYYYAGATVFDNLYNYAVFFGDQ
jgi:hypothetical protein